MTAEPQMTPFDIGQIKAHMEHGLGATEIARRVFKAGGKNTWSDRAVAGAMERLKGAAKVARAEERGVRA